MKIYIYISQPLTGIFSNLRVIDKLGELTGGNVQVVVVSKSITLSDDFDDTCNNLRHMKDCDFAVFTDDWKDDKRCVVERCAANEYGIPYCDEHNLETFFKDYIKKSFNFDI